MLCYVFPKRSQWLSFKHVLSKCTTVACAHNLPSREMTRWLVRPGCQKSVSVYIHLSEHVVVCLSTCHHLWLFIYITILCFHHFNCLSKHLVQAISPFPSNHMVSQNLNLRSWHPVSNPDDTFDPVSVLLHFFYKIKPSIFSWRLVWSQVHSALAHFGKERRGSVLNSCVMYIYFYCKVLIAQEDNSKDKGGLQYSCTYCDSEQSLPPLWGQELDHILKWPHMGQGEMSPRCFYCLFEYRVYSKKGEQHWDGDQYWIRWSLNQIYELRGWSADDGGRAYWKGKWVIYVTLWWQAVCHHWALCVTLPHSSGESDTDTGTGTVTSLSPPLPLLYVCACV